MAKLNFNKRKYGKFATCFNKIVGLFSKKASFEFLADKPSEPCIIVCNHTALQAPFAFELYYGDKLNFWTNAKLNTYKNGIDHFRTVLAKITKYGFLMPLAYVLMPIINLYFRSYQTIPAWHDIRVKETYAATVNSLADGCKVMITPETKDTPMNKYIKKFQRGFAYSAYYWYKETGKCLKFYPSYCDAKTRRIVMGEPTVFDPEAPLKQEAERITVYLEEQTTALGEYLEKEIAAEKGAKEKDTAAKR